MDASTYDWGLVLWVEHELWRCRFGPRIRKNTTWSRQSWHSPAPLNASKPAAILGRDASGSSGHDGGSWAPCPKEMCYVGHETSTYSIPPTMTKIENLDTLQERETLSLRTSSRFIYQFSSTIPHQSCTDPESSRSLRHQWKMSWELGSTPSSPRFGTKPGVSVFTCFYPWRSQQNQSDDQMFQLDFPNQIVWLCTEC